MRNIGSIISSHNRATLHPATTLCGCNCRVKDSCPLNGECLTPKLVYRADIENSSNNEKKYYLGCQKQLLKNVIGTIKKNRITQNIKTVLNYQNTSGN